MLKPMLENVRANSPLVHNITNYVTVNDCANALLACGGAPIMADDPDEAKEIASLCGGVCINIGTLNKNTIPSMFLAGRTANELNHPVLLDPVGAGASELRTQTALNLMKEIKLSVIRGNISEIKTLALGSGTTKGVDADLSDTISDDTLDGAIAFAKEFAQRTGAVIVITGAIDIVASSEKSFVIRNGSPLMPKISGTGCALSSITTAYVTANKPSDILTASAAAVCLMGLCGERAFVRLGKGDGNLTYRSLIFDELSCVDGDMLDGGAKYEII